jgi:hypothetical protein
MRQMTTRLELPFFKQGDDLSQLLDGGMTHTAAMTTYATRLREAATKLERVAAATNGKAVTVSADVHSIYLHGPEDDLRPLIEQGLLVEDEELGHGDA